MHAYMQTTPPMSLLSYTVISSTEYPLAEDQVSSHWDRQTPPAHQTGRSDITEPSHHLCRLALEATNQAIPLQFHMYHGQDDDTFCFFVLVVLGTLPLPIELDLDVLPDIPITS